MNNEEIFCPEIKVQIGQYQIEKGISVNLWSSKSADKDWGKLKFSKAFQSQITINENDPVKVYLGYAGKLEKVFSGVVTSSYNQGAGADEILIQDKSRLLERTIMKDSFHDCTPQEIILAGLSVAGVTDYKLSQDVYLPKTVPVSRKNMIDVLKQINQVWKLEVSYGFIGGVFYWGVQPNQDVQQVFSYGENIISLSRDSGLWLLETICIPMLQHSQIVSVHHPKVSGDFLIQKIHIMSDESGFIRYQIYF